MKIYISADIEGVCGITHPRQTLVQGPENDLAIAQLVEEVNAAIAGALDGGAREITVNDSHYSMRNLSPARLHPAAKLISGFPKALLMMAGIDSTYDGAALIGYHARAGSTGVLAHTISSQVFSAIRINGRECGEAALSAAAAGHFNVPVIMASGDNILRDEIQDLNPAISFAEVKMAIGTRAAQSVSAGEACTRIRESLKAAVMNRNKPDPWQVTHPVTLQATLCSPLITDVAEAIPGFKRISANDVIYTADDMLAIMKAIFIILSSAGILFTDPYR